MLGLGDREISRTFGLVILAKLMNSDFSEQPCVKELCKMIEEDIQCLPLASTHIHTRMCTYTCICTYAHEHTPGCFELHISRLLREGAFLFAGSQESSHASFSAQLYSRPICMLASQAFPSSHSKAGPFYACVYSSH